MKGYVWAFDHPFSAVTDAQGNFAIRDAPVGTWRLVLWHEKTGIVDWDVQRLGRKIVVKDGPGAATDLGTIALDADEWDEVNKKE